MVISLNAKKIAKLLLKLTVSGAAIAFVVSKIDIAATWSTMRSAQPAYLLAALVVYAISQLVSAMRLNTLFATMPLPLGTAMNMRLYWLGMFYNFFLPGGIGGDGYKVYYLNRHYRQPVKSLIAAIFSDRMSGLAAIVIYLLTFSSFFIENLPFSWREFMWIGIPIVIAGYYIALRYIKASAMAVATKVLCYSLAIQAIQMCAATLVLFSIDSAAQEIDNYMFLFLASSIASAIPVTLGGMGAREMAFVLGSTYLGTDETTAVALSLLFYIVSLISSTPGILYAIRPKLIEGKKPHKGTPNYTA